MKFKIFPIIAVLFFLALSLIPYQAQAAGLVPCGGCERIDPATKACLEKQPDCQLCHGFVLINNIIRFVFSIVFPVATLMFIVAGFYLLIAGGRPEWFNNAKNAITATVVGLVIIFAALVLLNTVLDTLGVAEWTKTKGSWWSPSSEWWSTTCPVR